MYRVRVSRDAERDLGLLFDFLIEAYQSFGDQPARAFDRASECLLDIRNAILALHKAPFRGTLHNDLLPGLRHVTVNRAIVWFQVDETEEDINVLAIFFGGQDHQKLMLMRLLSEE